MKVTRKITHKELAQIFINLNTGVKVLEWQPLINDGCKTYADNKQPMIRVDLEDGNWLRVYVSKEYSEITWY